MGDNYRWQTLPGKEEVLFREHPTCKNGRVPDRCYSIRYRAGEGKRMYEALSWASDGWTVAKAIALLRELKENIRTGKRPQSLREMRSMAEEQRQREAQRASKARIVDLTFGELAECYEEWCLANRASGAQVRQILVMHVLPVLGHIPARDVTPQDVADLGRIVSAKRPLSGRNKNTPGACLSAQTVLHILKTVREVYNYALETPAPGSPGTMLFSGPNPAILSRRNRAIVLPKTDSRRLRVLSDTEIEILLAYQGQREEFGEVHDMMLLSLDTGLRAG